MDKALFFYWNFLSFKVSKVSSLAEQGCAVTCDGSFINRNQDQLELNPDEKKSEKGIE